MSTKEYHTTTSEGNPPTRTNVFHDKEKCPEGKRISPQNHRSGRGSATHLCDECPKISS
jgi:hypothetical protein